MMFCYKCGNQLPEEAKFCHKCGARTLCENVQQQFSDTSKLVHESKESIPLEELKQMDAESIQISEPVDKRFNDQEFFKKYVNNYIQENTGFQSTEELLDSHAPINFVRKSFGISGAIGVLLCIYGYASGNLNFSDVGSVLGCLGIVFFALMIGYLVAYVIGLYRQNKETSKYGGKFEGNINIDDLIPFLGEHLSYLHPYFQQWGYVERSTYGIRSAVSEAVANSIRNSLKEVSICSAFGKKQRRIILITIRPDVEKNSLGKMEYYFTVENRIEATGILSFLSHDTGFEKYKCLVQISPILHAAMEYYLNGYKTKESADSVTCHDSIEKETVIQQPEAVSDPVKQHMQDTQTNTLGKKKRKKLPVILGTVVLIIILVTIIAVNWEGKIDYVASVKAHTPFAISQGLPYTYEEVLCKYFDSLTWEVSEDGDAHYVDISGMVKGMDSKFALTVKVSLNPDIPDSALMEPVSVTLGDRQSTVDDEVTRVLYNLFCMYDEGYEVDAESELTNISEVFYAEYEEAARSIVSEWFERHPLVHNIRVQFKNKMLNPEKGEDKYLVYEMYSISGAKYGIFYVNPNNGDMMMDSVIDNTGEWSSIQVSMDQWYLEYYWGLTDESGYYSELYEDDTYYIYDGEGGLILAYYANSDSYEMYNEIHCFLEYDDGSAASEISIMDFAGVYSYDGSFEEDGNFLDFYYLLEIEELGDYQFSITESWRGNTMIQAEWVVPKSLIVDTLIFEVFNAASLNFETHSLTYVPAKNSPLGKDMIYIDGDDAMPFIRE